MWRSYYDHRWGALALDGLRASCGQYGFSWWDGALPRTGHGDGPQAGLGVDLR